MRGREFLARLREEVLIGDGALGTLISERGLGRDTGYERLNLTHPEFIRDLHAAYLDAGAKVIETNTFGANRTKLVLSAPAARELCGQEVSDLNRAGVALAREAAGDHAYVAGSVGPLADHRGPLDTPPLTDDEVSELFREQIVALADAGADLLILETFTDLHQLLLALGVARKHTDLPVVCQLAFHERGHTYAGVHVSEAVAALTGAGADVIGANCGRGVRCVKAAVEEMTRSGDHLVSAYPNAGLPAFVAASPLLGRGFGPDDTAAGAPAVAMLSYEVWQRDYAGERDVLGRAITLDGVSHTIIGVMPARWDAFAPVRADVWFPLALDLAPGSPGAAPAVEVLARLRADVSPDAVNRELDGLDTFLAATASRLNAGRRFVVLTFQSLEDRIVKHTFRDLGRGGPEGPLVRVLTRHPLTPSDDEVRGNPRSRSAKLRAVERIS